MQPSPPTQPPISGQGQPYDQTVPVTGQNNLPPGYPPPPYGYPPHASSQMGGYPVTAPYPVEPPKPKSSNAPFVILLISSTILLAALGGIFVLIAGDIFKEVQNNLNSTFGGSSSAGSSSLSAGKQGAWQTFTSKEGRFTISMPGTPGSSKQGTATAIGNIDLYMFTLGTSNNQYAIGYADFPENLVAGGSTDAMLEGAKTGAATNVGGTILAERKVWINNWPGREVSIGLKDGKTIKARYYLVKNRLYEIMVGFDKGKEVPADTTRYMDSFRITG